MKCPKCKADNPDDSQFCRKCGSSLTKIPATLTSPPAEKEKKEASKKSALDFAPGQYFGKRYQIIEEIGRGGMGKVYKALDKELNRTVALKMIKPELSSHPGIVARFKKEIKLASQITHENVCRIHDLGEVKGIKYISMEFIEGQNLHDFIQAAKRLSVETAINITEQICQALAAAHNKGVIHRDLKPQNIMIDKKGSAYVMDFGIARSLEAEGVTKPGVIIGTPHYMSPEQGEGKAVDARSDLYSLGCIFYEMLTGKPPFEADTSMALLHKHLNETPQLPSKLNPQIPQILEITILKCLEKQADKRYSLARELQLDLQRLSALFPFGRVTPGTIKSLAVLPLENISGDPEQEYFGDGMTEALIINLAKIRALSVISRTSVMQYKGVKKPLPEIARELNVDAVVEGTVLRAGERVRISAQLIESATDRHLWAESYERDLSDILKLQSEVAQTIAREIKVTLTPEEEARLAKARSVNPEAHEAYIRAIYYWDKRTEEGLKKAIGYYQQTIEKDPTYALAYAGTANCYNILAVYHWLPPKDAYPKARAAAEKALKIDENLAEAHNSLGGIKMFYDWDFLAAEREFKRAIELNPGYALAHHWYSVNLMIIERYDESIAEAERALELDPLSLASMHNLGNSLSVAGQHDRAIEQFQKIIEMDPNYPLAHYFLATAYFRKEMYNEAVAEAQKAIDLGGREAPAWIAELGYIYSFSGKIDEAKKVLNKFLAKSKHKHVPAYHIALIYAGLGQKGQAIEWLEKAYEERDLYMIFLKTDPRFDSLRSDPKFKALNKKMNLK